jgi:hypothetical protein
VLGLKDALKLLPRDTKAPDFVPTKILRQGSEMYRVYEVLKAAGRPLQILEILSAIGKDKSQRASLTGALGHYVRKGEIFTRPDPNVFGLKEFEQEEGSVSDEVSEPPSTFGTDNLESADLASEDIPF